jgi:hypothetical protein
MQFSIKKMKGKLKIVGENNKPISYNGYAFLDKYGHCIIITYGEDRMKDVKKYLSMPL